MKIRLFFTVVFALIAVVAKGDDKSKSLLDALTAKITSYKSYKVDFVASMQDEFSRIPGSFLVCGDKYFMDINGTEVYSDGKVKQTFNVLDNEVVIENIDIENDKDLLANPSRFFKQNYNDFNHTYKGTAVVGGRTVEVVELKPKESGTGFVYIDISIDPVTKLPVQVSSKMEGITALVNIRIDKITPDVEVSPSMFTFDKNAYKDVEIIDFR